jgi:hypothetical protein
MYFESRLHVNQQLTNKASQLKFLPDVVRRGAALFMSGRSPHACRDPSAPGGRRPPASELDTSLTAAVRRPNLAAKSDRKART